ncbi:hypothetical protein [Ruegeria lacuscaerulensis]|uniref:hypothetical protein n=1 Tax=Ruegeria lacuscaerulensis TaxID=55218 RepID=UPI001F33FC68|nr:hypothetical protein [Ruegeria lacuscaerulensis]
MTGSLNERIRAQIEQDRQVLNNHRVALQKTSKDQMQKLASGLQEHAQTSVSACENALKDTANAIEKLKVETIQSADKSLSAHLSSLESQLNRYSETSRQQLKTASVWTLGALVVSALIVLSGFGLGWIGFNWNKSELESMTAEKSALTAQIEALKHEQAELSGIGLQVFSDPSGIFLSRLNGKDLLIQPGFTITNPNTGQKQQVVKIRN